MDRTQDDAATDRGVMSACEPPNLADTDVAPTADRHGVALVDYLTVSFREERDIRGLRDLFGPEGWVNREGRYFYQHSLLRGGTEVHFDGTLPGMGVCLNVSNCRELEHLGVVTDWPAFLRELTDLGGKFTRIDLALDDRSGLLCMEEIRRHFEAGHFCCFANRKSVTEVRQSTQEVGTLYFGSGHSPRRTRFYDKARQTGTAGPWVRCEFVARGEFAEKAAQGVAGEGLHIVAGILKEYLDFKVPGKGKQPFRWKTEPWWEEFLGRVARYPLVLDPRPDTTLEEKIDHGWRQFGPLLAADLELKGGDLDYLIGKLNLARERQRPELRALVGAALLGSGSRQGEATP